MILEWSGHTVMHEHFHAQEFVIVLTIRFDDDEFVRHIYDRLLLKDDRAPLMAMRAAQGIQTLARWGNS